ncbi:extracellular solute-binding protein [Paenibacillus filicis]|uniref:Extracellular solute-binding protein n=1 Tax=Paenibacillus gyeongsangnamensis TaxID=3388067 RepID=A0ABT4QLU2_9BACL|nr:extracellular solute-binding protein [Paenibacillus filicis]MCZ8517833.1 extracellular solute-binding protein [Paenibacillus filicis]
MLKKNISFMLISTLLFTTAACSSNKGSSSSGDTAVGNDNEKANLVIYSQASSGFDEKFGTYLKKKFPNYTITSITGTPEVTLQSLITSNQQIDIVWDSIGYWPNNMLATGLEYDMTELLKKHKVDLNRFEPTLVDAVKGERFNNKILGLPVYNNNMVLFYNKDIFNKFGVQYPKDGMTWDEAIELSRKLNKSDGGKNYFGLYVSINHYVRTNQFSADTVDPKTLKTTINTDDRWKKMYQKLFIDVANDAGYRTYLDNMKASRPGESHFYTDKELAMFGFLSSLTLGKELETMNWDMVSLPTFSEMPKVGSQFYPVVFSVTKTSNQKDAAMNVINYLVSDEYQSAASKNGQMTVLNNDKIKKEFGQDTKWKDKNVGALFYNKAAKINNKSDYEDIVESALRGDLVNLMKGSTDINTALRKAEEKANKSIQEAKK